MDLKFLLCRVRLVAQTYSPSTQEDEDIIQVQAQDGLHTELQASLGYNKTLPQNLRENIFCFLRACEGEGVNEGSL